VAQAKHKKLKSEETMLNALDLQSKLTTNQYKLIASATFGIVLEFLDYFLIGFILTFVATPWHLTFGQSSVILLSSGIGSMLGAFFFGRLADKIGRRRVFLCTILVFTLGTAALIVTPDSETYGWLYLTFFRLLIGFGAGGLYCVDLPLVQEFMPARKRGVVSGLVTSAVPLGFLLGSALVAFASSSIGWRGVMVVCVALSCLTLLMRSWVPESPRWLLQSGDVKKARQSVAWALEVDPETLPLNSEVRLTGLSRFSDLFRYPRSFAVSWLTNLGAQTGYYGLTLWSPTLIVLFLHVRPDQAAFYMIFVTFSAFAGRITLAILSEKIGRRASGILCCGAAAVILLFAALSVQVLQGATLPLLLTLMAAYFFGEGGLAIVGPYAAEVWPSSLRTTGMGSAYGFGGLGKIIGPLGLALIVGSSLTVTPQAAAIPVKVAFLYFAAWYAMAAAAYLILGIETRGRSIEAISEKLHASAILPSETSSQKAGS
jgi:MFS transporter, putative metabolite:H+ symporter